MKTAAGEMFSLEVSTRCNSSCSHCFARAGRDRVNELDTGTAVEIISEAAGLGYRDLHITGGEPMMWPPLHDVLHQASALGYESVFINSNGTLLDSRACEMLRDCGTEVRLSVSLQGPEDLHDSVRGDGAWAAAVKGMRAALSSGLSVTVFTTAGRSLIDGLPSYASDIFSGFPSIESLMLIQLIRVENDALDLSEDLLRPEDFIRLVKITALLNLSGMKVGILENPLARVAALCMGMPWIRETPSIHRPGRIIVMADRSISMSHSCRKSLGVYRPGKLGAVMDSVEYIGSAGPDDRLCAECPYMDCCRKDGMLRPSEWYRDMGGTEPYCRRVLDMAVPLR